GIHNGKQAFGFVHVPDSNFRQCTMRWCTRDGNACASSREEKMTRTKPETSRLGVGDVVVMRRLNQLFSEAFEDPASYAEAEPDDAYLARLLAKPDFIALVACDGDSVVGGLVAYQLEEFEQARSEIYIYDLALADTHRWHGIASDLIARLKPIARE